MWGIFAIVAFAIAFILNIIGGQTVKYVLDAELIGFILLTVHLVAGNVGPWFRRGSPPA